MKPDTAKPAYDPWNPANCPKKHMAFLTIEALTRKFTRMGEVSVRGYWVERRSCENIIRTQA